jgi:hypothetical protein
MAGITNNTGDFKMFWKILGGIAALIMIVVLAVGLVATVSLAAVGVAVGTAVENLDVSTVEVIDSDGNTETYTVGELLSETSRVEVTGDNGEQVTIDLNLPEITVQENDGEVSRVIIGDDSGVVFSDGSQVRINGRNFNTFDGGFIGRLIGGIFRGLFTLAFWTLVIVGIVLVVRNRKPADSQKTPDAVA